MFACTLIVNMVPAKFSEHVSMIPLLFISVKSSTILGHWMSEIIVELSS